MTDWPAIIAAGFAMPAESSPSNLVDELLDALTSPDPVLRDEQAYPVLASWIVGGHLDGQLAVLGDRTIQLFANDAIQARTFAALVLAALIHRDTAAGTLDTTAVLGWRDAFADWWPTETDLRGWDDQLGWLHAAAHGADVVGELGLSPRLDGDQLAGLLDLACSRLLAPTTQVFAHQEDDRIALAVATVLTRRELSCAATIGWLDPIRDYFESKRPGPVPAPAANTMRTLRSLYLMTDRGFRRDPGAPDRLVPPHRSKILDAIADLLRIAFPPQI